MTDDFTKGWSQGMTGQTGGNPSQSVLEAMGRNAARNHWNNNRPQAHGGYAGSGSSTPGVPLTKILLEAGQKMSLRKLGRDYAVSIAAIVIATPLASYLSGILSWPFVAILWAATIYLFWTMLRTPLCLLAMLGNKKPESPEAKED